MSSAAGGGAGGCTGAAGLSRCHFPPTHLPARPDSGPRTAACFLSLWPGSLGPGVGLVPTPLVTLSGSSTTLATGIHAHRCWVAAQSGWEGLACVCAGRPPHPPLTLPSPHRSLRCLPPDGGPCSVSGRAAAHYLPGSRTGPGHRALCRSAPGSGPHAQSRPLAAAPVPAWKEENPGVLVPGSQQAWGKGHSTQRARAAAIPLPPRSSPPPQDLPPRREVPDSVFHGAAPTSHERIYR